MYELPELPYSSDALEPLLSQELVELHHDAHHAAYVKGANETLDKLDDARRSGEFDHIGQLEKNLAFNVSGHVLHSLLWKNLTPGDAGEPNGELAAALKQHFGTFGAFKEQLTAAAAGVQGSGWGALSWEPLGGRLLVELSGADPGRALRGIRVCRDHFDHWFGITASDIERFETNDPEPKS